MRPVLLVLFAILCRAQAKHLTTSFDSNSTVITTVISTWWPQVWPSDDHSHDMSWPLDSVSSIHEKWLRPIIFAWFMLHNLPKPNVQTALVQFLSRSQSMFLFVSCYTELYAMPPCIPLPKRHIQNTLGGSPGAPATFTSWPNLRSSASTLRRGSCAFGGYTA